MIDFYRFIKFSIENTRGLMKLSHKHFKKKKKKIDHQNHESGLQIGVAVEKHV